MMVRITTGVAAVALALWLPQFSGALRRNKKGTHEIHDKIKEEVGEPEIGDALETPYMQVTGDTVCRDGMVGPSEDECEDVGKKLIRASGAQPRPFAIKSSAGLPIGCVVQGKRFGLSRKVAFNKAATGSIANNRWMLVCKEEVKGKCQSYTTECPTSRPKLGDEVECSGSVCFESDCCTSAFHQQSPDGFCRSSRTGGTYQYWYTQGRDLSECQSDCAAYAGTCVGITKSLKGCLIHVSGDTPSSPWATTGNWNLKGGGGVINGVAAWSGKTCYVYSP